MDYVPEPDRQRLRLMTYNIQVGIRTRQHWHYYRQAWRHVLPPVTHTRHLEPIARMLRGQDLIAVQEADAGSMRTRGINLLHFMAEKADYPHWHLHSHRNLAPVARHGMGLLSRYPIFEHEPHTLPGRIPGRAAVVYRLGNAVNPLTVVVTHLALGRADRDRQLRHIRDLLHNDEHVILMGDLNCDHEELHQHPLFRERGFLAPGDILHSYPSWRPDRQLDHILVTPDIDIVSSGTTAFKWSDHLPVTMEVELPAGMLLDETT